MDDHHHQHDIFLSHSGHQKGFVIHLYQRLSSMGYSVFFDRDRYSLPLGQPFPPLILNAAKHCKLAVVVLSNEFLASKWPMIELCEFARRLLPVVPDHPNVRAPAAFTLLPLFFGLSPADIKDQKNVEAWETQWKRYEAEDERGRFIAVDCKQAVSKLLTPLNGIVRRLESEQGDYCAYMEEVVQGIIGILAPPLRFTDPRKKYSGRNRLCDIILNKFRDLEQQYSCPSPAHNFVVPYTEDPAASSPSSRLTPDIHVSILGMYGVPGSGKSTLCKFLYDGMAYSDEFKGNAFYMELPTKLDPRNVSSDEALLKEKYLELLSRFTPHQNISSRNLNEIRNLLLHTRWSRQFLLVIDNITPHNYENYKDFVLDVLSSTLLGCGSRVMVVAQSRDILRNLLGWICSETTQTKRLEDSGAIPVNRFRGETMQQCVHYRYTITQIPCLEKDEAMEIIRNMFPSVDEHLAAYLLLLCSFPSSSFMYIPFVFEQIRVLLKQKRYNNINELESDVKVLREMVDKGKKDAVQKLVEMNVMNLREDLRVLFFDIALLIIPAGFSNLQDAISILSCMHRVTDTVMKNIWMAELQDHCFLSVIQDAMQVHDIFIDYAKSIPENSTRYVNRTIPDDDAATLTMKRW